MWKSVKYGIINFTPAVRQPFAYAFSVRVFVSDLDVPHVAISRSGMGNRTSWFGVLTLGLTAALFMKI